MSHESWDQLIKVANPVAGSQGVFTVPGEVYVRPWVVRFSLNTSAAAGSRFPTLDFTDNDDVIWCRAPMDSAIAASLTATYTFALEYGSQSLVTSGEGFGPLANVRLPPGYKVKATAVGLQAGDTITGFTIWARRYPTGEWAPSTGATPYDPEYL